MSFKNENINQLNLHSVLLALGQNLVQVFGVVYFLQKGFEPHLVVGGWALLNLFRFILRPFIYKIIRSLGIKKSVFLGTFLFAGVSLIVPFVTTPDLFFVGFILYFAICDLTYWFSYHAFFSLLSDGQHRGSEVCVRETMLKLAGAFAPALGGILIQYTSFFFAGLIAALLTVAATFLLLDLPEIKIKKDLKIRQVLKVVEKDGFKLWFGWAVLFYMFSFIWSIVLFYLSGSFSLFGGMLTLEILFSVVTLTIMGKLIDHKKHSLILKLAVLVLVFVILFRAIWVNTLVLVVVSQIFTSIAMSIFRPVLITSFYTKLKQSKYPLGFMLLSEWGWDIGSFLSLLSAAILIYFGVSFAHVMLLSFPGLLLCYYLLTKNIDKKAISKLNSIVHRNSLHSLPVHHR